MDFSTGNALEMRSFVVREFRIRERRSVLRGAERSLRVLRDGICVTYLSERAGGTGPERRIGEGDAKRTL